MEAADFAALLRGAAFTVLFSVAAVAIGVPAGLGLALVRWARVPVASPVVAVLVSILRAAPAVTLALLIFFALPRIGLSLDPVLAGIATLALSTAAFNCEIWRASLLALPRDYAAMNALYASYFPPDRLPARTTVGVTGLARGGIVEIDMIAKR